MGKGAPEQNSVGDGLHIIDDGSTRGAKTRSRLKEGVGQVWNGSGKHIGESTKERSQDPAESDDDAAFPQFQKR